jgi:hypothetical protein
VAAGGMTSVRQLLRGSLRECEDEEADGMACGRLARMRWLGPVKVRASYTSVAHVS